MVRTVQTASLLVVSVLVGCAGTTARATDEPADARPPSSLCRFALDPAFDAPPTDSVYAAVLDNDPEAVQAHLAQAHAELREQVAREIRDADAFETAPDGSGDGAAEHRLRSLHDDVRALTARPGAPLRVGPTRFYLSEPLAVLGFAAARLRGDDVAALAWLDAGGIGRGDSGRLGVCRIAMALEDGASIDPMWVRAIDANDPALADWMRWLRSNDLAEPADVWGPSVGAAP